jgi:hypothetical protein
MVGLVNRAADIRIGGGPPSIVQFYWIADTVLARIVSNLASVT